MKKRLRKQLIVVPRVQYKLMVLVFLSIIIPVIITFVCIYFLISTILTDAKMTDELVYMTLLFASRRIYLILAAGIGIISIMLLYWSTLFLHRIVGPMYRLERELEKVIQGESTQKIRFRKHDQFAALASKINILTEKIKSQK